MINRPTLMSGKNRWVSKHISESILNDFQRGKDTLSGDEVVDAVYLWSWFAQHPGFIQSLGKQQLWSRSFERRVSFQNPRKHSSGIGCHKRHGTTTRT